VAVCAVAAPIAAALHVARQQAEKEEVAVLAGVAVEILRLATITRSQIDSAIAVLADTRAAPCSEQAIRTMRQLDVASTFIQAVGHVRDGRLVCSSLGIQDAALLLGPPTGWRKPGVNAWRGVRLPFMPNLTVNVYEKDGTVVIVNPNLVIDAMGPLRADIVLGVVATRPPQLVRARGKFPAAWVRAWDGDATLVRDGYLLVVRMSKYGDVVGLAAAPVTAANQRLHALAWMMVPAGGVAGLLLAAAFYILLTRPVAAGAELRGALDRGELFLEYQPVVCLQTGACVGAEALIRWRRADGSMVRPDIFIAEAEDVGMIRAITRFVIDTVEREAPTLVGLHPAFHVAINCSAADLESQEFADMVSGLIRTPGLAPENIVIEATERRLFNTELVRSNVAAVRRIGVPVAIDDFGTGYSSLSYLELFRTDFLKIDQSFIGTVGTDAVTSQVVPHIIEMAKSLGMQMIAEGVETEAQARYLRERGVQYAQGWLFAKPMSAAELAAYVVHCRDRDAVSAPASSG
jgi:sensor c-di-GMP phosphodiesterase-like protein